MALTRSWEGVQPRVAASPREPRAGSWTLLPLAAASCLVAFGLYHAHAAKTREFAEAAAKLQHGDLLNLNTVPGPEQVQPFLLSFQDAAQRQAAAEQTFAFLKKVRPLRNVGTLAALRASRTERLLPVAKLKPLAVVRTPREFEQSFARWIAAYFASFYLVWLFWRLRGFRADPWLLPILHLLTGIGLILMISLRDPLRDTLEFRKFALGVCAGLRASCCCRSSGCFSHDGSPSGATRRCSRRSRCSACCCASARGPAGNDAKVNLGPFQPVELIKILLVLFLAGYFARNWERLRDLRAEAACCRASARIDLPRLAHVLPVLCAVGIALAMFFLLKDLGPALVTCFLFLAMFAVARGRPGLAIARARADGGSAVTLGYRMGSRTRWWTASHMWLSPWDNDVRGGNQLAHSLWAFSTGGPLGSGPGWGDPGDDSRGQYRPGAAGHRRRVGLRRRGRDLPAVRVPGARAPSASPLRRPATHFGLFLALGLASLIAFEMLLISRRRAGRDAALRRGVAVPQFRQHGHAGEFPGLRAAGFVRTTVAASRAARTASPSPCGGWRWCWRRAGWCWSERPPITRCCTIGSIWRATLAASKKTA